MTDKEKIREVIERKLDVMQFQVHRKDAYKELRSILDYIDSLQDEPVSEDLEEAAIEYCGGHKGADARVRAGFIMGAMWQKEKIMNIL